MESGDIAPFIPDLVTESRWMVSFKFQSLHEREVSLGLAGKVGWVRGGPVAGLDHVTRNRLCPAGTAPSDIRCFRHYSRSAVAQTSLLLHTVNRCYNQK